ncbi:MAG: C39 family peptidase [Thermoleophilia bacterium]|nr:C39 family peptidase [Thermoleophilia bacterium]
MAKRTVYLAMALVLLVALGGGVMLFLHQRGARSEPIPSAGGAPLSITPVSGVPYYLQNDPAWAAETLGESEETMAAAGCTVTSIAMGLSALGQEMDPAEACAALEEAGGFTGSGQIIWAAVSDITGGAVGIGLPAPNPEVIDTELREGRPVIVKIMLGETVPHWLLVVGKEGSEYLAMDPLNQERELVRLSDRGTAIHAVRVFRRG